MGTSVPNHPVGKAARSGARAVGERMARNPAECTRRIRVFEHLLERRQIAVDVVQNGQHALA
jgi:hypothetical protein